MHGKAVAGWLLLLSRLLVVWQPLNLAVAGMAALGSVAVRGPAVVIILIGRALVAAVGIAAGLAISNRHSGAVALARAALLFSLAADLFVYSTPYFPSNRAPGDTKFYVAGSLAYHLGWLVYLSRSRRVRETF